MTTTDEPTTTDAAALADGFLAAWNAEDVDDRAAAVTAAFADDAVTLDPIGEARGHEGIADFIAGVVAQYPGHRFRRTSEVDVHHDRARFSWEMTGPDGAVALVGTEAARLTADGRLAECIAFFGPLADRETA